MAKFKRVWKGSQTFVHDLYRLEVSTCLRNQSYKMGDPIIEKIEHKHFFHSVDRKGKKLTRSTITADHFHDIEVELNKAGEITAIKCGPAKRVTEKLVGPENFRKRVKSVESPSWIKHANEGIETITDEHTHEITYVTSEELSPGRIASSQNQDKVRFQAMQQSESKVTDDDTNSSGEDLG